MMKKVCFLLLALMMGAGAMGQGWPAQYTGVMLQGFYWDSYDDTSWAALEQQADQLSGTFDLVWLPQSANCGGTSMGYDDLYWFSNYNSSFGTEAQLRSLIATFRSKGIKTIADVVINHRKNLTNWVDFPRETYKGVTYEMLSTDICRNDDGGQTLAWANQNGYSLSANNDTGEGWPGMRDIDHKSQNVQTIVKAYLDLLKNDLGYAGFRYDMVKGYSASFTGLYNVSANPEFSVGECWDGTQTIRNWIDGTKVDGVVQSAAFDFQFRYTVRNACNNGTWNKLGQQNDTNWPLVSSNYENGQYRRYAVTFVENHDTERRSNAAQDPLTRDTLAANAYLMAMPGTPCVFFTHWQAYPTAIKAMVAARKQAGINNESSYQNFRSSSNYFANIITTGGENRLLVALGNLASMENAINNTQQWVKVLSGHHYAYYFPMSMNTAYADLPSGTYVGAQKAVLTAVTSAAGARLVYTTNGQNPTSASTQVASGTAVDIPVGTSTLKVGMLINGQVSGIVSRSYVVTEGTVEQPVDIPAFCTVTAGETCAFFEAPATWGNVKCWRWDRQYNYTGNKWPGVDCTLLGTASNGNKVWKWSWNGSKTSQTSSNEGIIFNDGTSQTADLAFENAGYYTKDGLKGNVLSGISTPTVPPVTGRAYTLGGQRVDQQRMKPGIYVVNGRKVVVGAR